MRITFLLLAAAFLSALLGGCGSDYRLDPVLNIATAEASANPEAVSRRDERLYRSAMDHARRARLEKDLSDALSAYQENPGGADEVIWVGRRLGYLGRYRDAILVYTEGLRRHGGSYRLLRHRGHRFITIRRFDDAKADLLEAARLVSGKQDQIEPDGDPSSAKSPRSTDKSNIFYHLGLVNYLLGNYAAAADAFGERRGLAGWNDDMIVSTTHWQYLSLRRAGRAAEAAAWLEQVRPDMDVRENHGYHVLCLLYQGLRTPEELLAAKPDGSPQEAGTVYGVAAFLELEGQTDRARELKEELGARGNWPGFGVIAAEADLARPAPR